MYIQHPPPVVVYIDADGRCCRRCDDGGDSDGEDLGAAQHAAGAGVGYRCCALDGLPQSEEGVEKIGEQERGLT